MPSAPKLRVALIGQSAFGTEVYKALRADGHNIVGVFTIPDKGGRPDPLALEAEKDGAKVFKFPRWRQKDMPIIMDVFNQYKECGAEVNVLAFCSQFIPMPVIEYPVHKSIVYHPSLLPMHRGASAINWTLMEGDAKAGFSIFWADDGLDTGPILLQKSTDVQPNDTVDTLYNRFMFPEGIKAMVEAVDLIATGSAPCIPQPEEGASYDPIWKKKEVALIPWPKMKDSKTLHNFIRGNDKVPGAWAVIEGKEVTFFNSSEWNGSSTPTGESLAVAGTENQAVVHADGMLLFALDGSAINVKQIQVDGKMAKAASFGKADEAKVVLELTDEESTMVETVRTIWKALALWM